MLDSGYTSQLTSNSLNHFKDNKLAGATANLLHASTTRSAVDIDLAAQEFEAVFLSQMMRHMFQDISTDHLFGGGHAEETWRSMLIEEYGKTISSAGGIGLADHVKQTLLGLQEI